MTEAKPFVFFPVFNLAYTVYAMSCSGSHAIYKTSPMHKIPGGLVFFPMFLQLKFSLSHSRNSFVSIFTLQSNFSWTPIFALMAKLVMSSVQGSFRSCVRIRQSNLSLHICRTALQSFFFRRFQQNQVLA